MKPSVPPFFSTTATWRDVPVVLDPRVKYRPARKLGRSYTIRIEPPKKKPDA